MRTDRLQGIIFSDATIVKSRRKFDTAAFTAKYFKRLIGFSLPGMDYMRSEQRKIVKRYAELQDDCSEQIASDLYERLRLTDTDR